MCWLSSACSSDVADVQVIVLRLSHISTMDATGAMILGDAITHLEGRGIVVLISGITEEHHELLTTLDVARDFLCTFGLQTGSCESLARQPAQPSGPSAVGSLNRPRHRNPRLTQPAGPPQLVFFPEAS